MGSTVAEFMVADAEGGKLAIIKQKAESMFHRASARITHGHR